MELLSKQVFKICLFYEVICFFTSDDRFKRKIFTSPRFQVKVYKKGFIKTSVFTVLKVKEIIASRLGRRNRGLGVCDNSPARLPSQLNPTCSAALRNVRNMLRSCGDSPYLEPYSSLFTNDKNQLHVDHHQLNMVDSYQNAVSLHIWKFPYTRQTFLNIIKQYD